MDQQHVGSKCANAGQPASKPLPLGRGYVTFFTLLGLVIVGLVLTGIASTHSWVLLPTLAHRRGEEAAWIVGIGVIPLLWWLALFGAVALERRHPSRQATRSNPASGQAISVDAFTPSVGPRVEHTLVANAPETPSLFHQPKRKKRIHSRAYPTYEKVSSLSQQPSSTAGGEPHDEGQPAADIALHLLGGCVVLWRGRPVTMSDRERSVLVYIASNSSQGKVVTTDMILEDVLRPLRPEAEETSLRNTFYQLRWRLEEMFQIPFASAPDPLLRKHGKREASWSVSERCQTMDLAQLEQMWATIKHERAKKSKNAASIFEACEGIIALYRGDFLGDSCPSEQWAQELRLRYQHWYLWSLWYVAEEERKEARTKLDEKDRQASYSRAGELFGRFSLHAVEDESSLKALRRSMWCHSQARDYQAVRQIYSNYREEMATLFAEWEHDDETQRLYEQCLQGTTNEYRLATG